MDKDWCEMCRTGKADFSKPSGTVNLCEEHMTPPETTWEERFASWMKRHGSFMGGIDSSQIIHLSEFIRAEKTKSYQEGLQDSWKQRDGIWKERYEAGWKEGLEKAKEVVGIAYLAARGKEENKVLLKAQEKIQELIDKG